MTTVHAEIVGDRAVLRRDELDQLLGLARRTEEVLLQVREDDVPALGIMRVAERGGAFDWLADEEDLYSVADLRVRYRWNAASSCS